MTLQIDLKNVYVIIHVASLSTYVTKNLKQFAAVRISRWTIPYYRVSV